LFNQRFQLPSYFETDCGNSLIFDIGDDFEGSSEGCGNPEQNDGEAEIEYQLW
jgi:hypothetical protein